MKRYRVTGTRPVLGNPPGSEFETVIPAEQEARLLGNRSLAVVPPDEGLSGLSRPELNSLAEQVGIERPDTLPNKGKVIEAIQAAPTGEAETASADEPPADDAGNINESTEVGTEQEG